MLVLDDILLSPIKGILWVAQQIHKAAEEEMDRQEEDIVARLSELYMHLETGRISEEEFDRQEQVLLDRLDALRDRKADEEDDPGGQAP